jgi:hypothetical protein
VHILAVGVMMATVVRATAGRDSAFITLIVAAVASLVALVPYIRRAVSGGWHARRGHDGG